jgi:Zinc carboxypeptidase
MKKELDLEQLFYSYKEDTIKHRYITNSHIEPLLEKLDSNFAINTVGYSVKGLPIYGIKIGNGVKKVLMWSQMHGNESTATKALFDVFNSLSDARACKILKHCTLFIIPILNPDGAEAYTRLNANNIDLNRDAQRLTQPESIVLWKVFNDFQPNICFNLHGQRTIFSAGSTNNPATISFLSPSQDEECTVTENRKIAMEVITSMNDVLQEYIPNQVGRYDDAFNINCVGDTFQSENIPTVLFEAGHCINDYSREVTRKYIYISLISALTTIASKNNLGRNYSAYFNIPENKKLFYDIIIRNAKTVETQKEHILDIAVQFDEILTNNKVNFQPKIKDFGNLSKFYGHKTIDTNKQLVKLPSGSPLKVGCEIDFVLINDKLFSLKVINN